MITRRYALTALLGSSAAGTLAAQIASGWISMFDGKSLNGWKEMPSTKHGKVSVEDGTIMIGEGHLTGVTWTGDFPQSGYEIQFEAARINGNDFFAGITFPVNDSFCSWINGGWGGSVVGLSSLDGDDASDNDTNTSRDFVKGRWYAFRLRVTKARIQGWIDGQVVVDADITGRRVGLRPGEIDLCTPLGFASYATTAGVRKIEYRLL